MFMFQDSVMFFLILLRAIVDGRCTRTRLLGILLRDGAIYYAVLFAFGVADIFMTSLFPLKRTTLIGVLEPAQLAAKSIGACHIVLNLKMYFNQRQPTIAPEHASAIDFVDRRTILDELSLHVVYEDQEMRPMGHDECP
ncbi:hypothetical protein BD410DRAFT_397952 [Rickenella mellea]|uniref:Uncharacterized protein n=1 Tax=Rickenella mellea TaxID=50990 RepID=A0A4Y7PWM9_9AGAM|nr:hypothetical protein BD410DRAFT_397952 [Rickenella mellea]